jgi:Kef-type K+ transport system membrane component KefB
MLGTLALLAAGGEADPLVNDLGLCLVAAAVLTIACRLIKVPAIAALLAAGVVVGPVGLALVESSVNIDTIADLGLVLLLFVIGLEVNLASLLRSGRALLVSGLLQVPLTVAIAWLLFAGLRQTGWDMLQGDYTALYLGLTCAFSSTLLVAGHLQSQRQMDTRSGRLAVGLLIFQDIWAVVVLALQPNFAHLDPTPVLLTLGGVAVMLAVAAVFTRHVLPRAFRAVGDAPQLVLTLAAAWCFGLGLFGLHLGDLLRLIGLDLDISISLGMGALIAGTSIATFPHAYEVLTKVGSLRDFFVTLFFVALGMSIPLPHGFDVVALALLLGVIAIALRQVLFLPLLLRAGVDVRRAAETSIKLSQISEFCLVIMYLGMDLGHVDERFTSAVIFAFVLTAVLSPALFRLAERSFPRLVRTVARVRGHAPSVPQDAPPVRPRLAILGFDRVGAALFCELERTSPDLLECTVVVDLDVRIREAIEARGARILNADLANLDALRHAGIDQAELIVIALTDDQLKGTDNHHITRSLRADNPDATIIASATRGAQVAGLIEAGASHVYMWPAETAAGLVPAIEAALGGELDEFTRRSERRHGPLAGRCGLLD